LTGDYANADWGVYNAISNGGNATGMWRTLTKDEWGYLLNERNASTVSGTENARYAWATVNGTAGLIVFPDSFTLPAGVVIDAESINVYSTINNVYSIEDWAQLESAGAIFLPAAGARTGTQVSGTGEECFYWSSTYTSAYNGYGMNNYDGIRVTSISRYYGCTVRLVKD
jgi:hypothetical protein